MALRSLFLILLLSFTGVSLGSEGEDGDDCHNRILHSNWSELMAYSTLKSLTEQLAAPGLSPEQVAELQFRYARELFVLSPTANEDEIRVRLDEALRQQPLHLPARMLAVSLNLRRYDTLGDEYAVAEGLHHIYELLKFPEVESDTKLVSLLELQREELETRVKKFGLAHPDEDYPDPRQEIEQTADVIWRLASTLTTLADKNELSGPEVPFEVLELVEQFGRRIVALFLEGQGPKAVVEYTQFMKVLYHQSDGLPPLVRSNLIHEGLIIADELSALGKGGASSPLKAWRQQVWKQFKSPQASARLSWEDLFIAGHLLGKQRSKELWNASLRLFRTETAFQHSEANTMDKIITAHLESLCRLD